MDKITAISLMLGIGITIYKAMKVYYIDIIKKKETGFFIIFIINFIFIIITTICLHIIFPDLKIFVLTNEDNLFIRIILFFMGTENSFTMEIIVIICWLLISSICLFFSVVFCDLYFGIKKILIGCIIGITIIPASFCYSFFSIAIICIIVELTTSIDMSMQSSVIMNLSVILTLLLIDIDISVITYIHKKGNIPKN